MQHNEFKNILIIKNRALGDSIFGLSVFKYLKSILPQTKLTYALPRWITKLYQNVEIDADTILPMDLNGLWGQILFLNHIRKGKYDAIIELHESSRSIRLVKIARFLFGIPYFTHNHHLDRFQMTGIYDQGIRKAITQRDLDGVFSFLRFFKLASTPPDHLEFCPEIKTSTEDTTKKIIIGIVATREEKKWPLSHYAKLISLLAHECPEHQFKVPVSPSIEDQSSGKSLLNQLDESIRNRVQLLTVPLNELPAELTNSSLYIGNDTGIKHLCAALGVKTLTVFGPEEPLEWHPYSKENHQYFWIYGTDVRNKMTDVCLLKQFDRTLDISSINPDHVCRVAVGLIKTN